LSRDLTLLTGRLQTRPGGGRCRDASLDVGSKKREPEGKWSSKGSQTLLQLDSFSCFLLTVSTDSLKGFPVTYNFMFWVSAYNHSVGGWGRRIVSFCSVWGPWWDRVIKQNKKRVWISNFQTNQIEIWAINNSLQNDHLFCSAISFHSWRRMPGIRDLIL
jgi:hypothetical protein